MKFEVEATPELSVNITPLAVSIIRVMMKPYRQFLAQMLKDERVTKEEMEQIERQVIEQGERLGELVEDELPRVKKILSDGD